MRNPGPRQTHFDTTKGTAEHQVVQIAQVADSEDASGHLSKTGAERKIVVLKDDVAKLRFFKSARHHYCGARRAIFRRIQTK
jgi:hypothetical protein